MTDQRLARKIGLPLLALYGLGTILGAGIYVLIGEVALSAGTLAPLSFLVAAIIAWVTAMSYSQLVVLFPRSAGEAVYVEKGFSLHWLPWGCVIAEMSAGSRLRILSWCSLESGVNQK